MLMFLTAFVLAQAPMAAAPAAPGDFRIESNVDSVGIQQFNGKLWIPGWVFECQSGLQPIAQRVGSVAISFYSASTPGFLPYVSQHYQMLGGFERPDVAAAHKDACPALGVNAGYWLVISDPPPPGIYMMFMGWATWNGANASVSHTPPAIRVVIQ